MNFKTEQSIRISYILPPFFYLRIWHRQRHHGNRHHMTQAFSYFKKLLYTNFYEHYNGQPQKYPNSEISTITDKNESISRNRAPILIMMSCLKMTMWRGAKFTHCGDLPLNPWICHLQFRNQRNRKYPVVKFEMQLQNTCQ